MKKIIVFTLFLSSLLFSTSCDKNFETINTDPNNPTEIESGLLIADALRNTGNVLYSTFVGGDMGSCWSQQWAKVQYNDEERYIPRESVIGMVWDGLYEDLASDANIMYKLAVAEENTNMQGVALTMKAYAFSLLTDLYGDVPFTEALSTDDGILSPAYDTQSDVYTGILTMLDDANTLFTVGEGIVNSSSDLMYNGDYMKWQKFANTLKFRVLMRMSSVSDVSAQLADVLTRPVFTSSSDEAKLPYLNSYPNANPIYETIIFGVRDEFKVSDVLVNMLAGDNDPRLMVYAQPNDDGDYRGKPAGIFNVPNAEYDYNNVSPVGERYLDPELPAYFLSYAEFMFLKAEAAQKGYISGTTADFFNAGVTASMNENGISTFSMPILSVTEATALEQIGNQKWLALYCQGVEAWTEWRRTGYPVLTPAIEGAIDEIPSRYTYPSSEQSLNATNYTNAVANQGADLLTTKVWWNK
ncbi:MAG: SusD/RagB family nutrient-binding outer membrane lipoprotein [Bacteroidales bacterium]|nr:SusD/RagB family nutrient-binding outer membrane lipoprotein [Bacteroidales bacterium]